MKNILIGAACAAAMFSVVQRGPEIGQFGPPPVPRPEDVKMSDLPAWPAFSASAENAMIFDAQRGARPLPNLAQIKAFDGYYKWLREQAKAHGTH